MTKTLSLLALAACAAAPSTSSETQALSTIVANGSFETGDYTGWSLVGSTWGIAADGQTIQRGDSVFDFVEQAFVPQFSPALPITYHATDGGFVALQLQTAAQDRRMFQTVSLPSCQPLLQWDMEYQVFGGVFDPDRQYIAVNIRDPETDFALATPFKTSDGDPTTVPTMTPFQIDLSAFSGQTVQLDFEQQVEIWHFPSAFDNIRIVCKGLGAVPGSIDFGPVSVSGASSPVPTTITNFAEVPLTMTSMSIDPSFVVTDGPAFPLTLQPGDSTQVSIAFVPSFQGPVTGSLVISSDDPNGPTTVALAGEGFTPNVSITPSVDFGSVRVGIPSPTQFVHLQNDGEFPATIDSLRLLSITFGIGIPNLPIVLPPGGFVDVPVTFTPGFEGPDSTQLTFFAGELALPTMLFGVGVAPHIATFPPSVDFGPQRVGTLGFQSLTISNFGSDVLSLGSITASPPFAIAVPPQSFVLPGDSVTVDVTFVAFATGPFFGSISISSDDPLEPVLTIPTSGLGTAPDVAVFPGAIDFGSARVSTTSAAQTVLITNPSTEMLTLVSFDTTGPFAASGAIGLSVPPGESTTIDVTFTPTAAGPAAGTLTIVTDAPTSPTFVSLAGTGVASILSVDTTPIDFGSQRVGTTGTKTVTVSNPGASPLVVSSATVASPFSVSPAGPLVVLPGAHASLVVSFAPSTTGLASGTLEISSDAGGAEIAVAGTGVQPLVSATPPAFDFGDVRVGATSASLFSITNPGTDTLHVTAVAFPPAFSPMPALRFPAAIAPGGSMSFNIVFAPTTHAVYSSSIAVATDAGPAAFAVTGRGVAPTLVASLDTLPFGPVAIGTTTSLSVQLANTGDAPATVSTISVIGSPDFSIVPLSLPTVVPAGGSLTASVAFAPTDHGLRSAKVVVASDAPPVSIAVAGTGSGARAIVAPGSLDLGTANVGATTAARGVTVSNTGDVGLVISAIVVAGPAASDFTSTTTTLPLTVGPGASMVLPFTLTPSVVGTRTATATLVTTDPLVPSSQLALAGTGTSPAIRVSPPSLEFGGVNVGGAIAKTFSITNTGTGPLSITSIDLAGPDASQFSVGAFAVPAVLAPSASATIHVNYAPTVLGTALAAVTVLSDDPAGSTVAVPVTGTGTSPSIAVAPTDLDFGAQVVGHPSALRQVHVTNLGSGPLTVTSLALTGAEASRFALVSPPPMPLSIATGNEVVLSVRVTPATTGSDDAALEIGTDAAPAAVSLAALGVATGLSVTPASIDFGSTHVPATTAPVTLTLTNLSADPIQLVDATLGGGSPGAFTVTSVAGMLAPGASTTAVVTFAPAAAGVDAATVSFAAKDTTLPQSVVTVGGKAVSTFVTADRDALEFGTIELGDRSGAKQVTLTNVTTAPITIASVVAADAQFVVDATLAVPIQPGQSASFTVTFVPAVEATTSSTVAITLAGASTPELVVAVTGEGGAASDTAGCSSTRSSSLWLVLVVLAVWRRRRRGALT